MGKKLNFLLLRGKTWRSLLFKVLFFDLILLEIYLGNFSPLAILIFGAALLWFYFLQSVERRHFRFSFIVLILAALLTLRFSGLIFAWLIFSFLFYLLLGLTSFVFKNSSAVYLFFQTCLFLIIFLFFFGLEKPEYFLLINILFFLITFLLLKEGFINSLFSIHNSLFISLVIAFLSLELFWAINLLPIGFINAAFLLTLFVFLMRDFALTYFSGRLNRKFLTLHLVIFLVLVTLIFIFSKWNL